jgi:hypothetical protein
MFHAKRFDSLPTSFPSTTEADKTSRKRQQQVTSRIILTSLQFFQNAIVFLNPPFGFESNCEEVTNEEKTTSETLLFVKNYVRGTSKIETVRDDGF